ncbi:MAG: SRPBCC domain-containing protein [Pseudonocardiaceae bacterium]
MKLKHEFTVPAPIDTVWQALLDPERIAPCFPGATLTSASGDEFAGIVKVRLGPISLQYRGSGRFTGTDEAAHRTMIEASGTATGGQGTAAAKVQASLAENGHGTTVTVVTDLIVTGKPAQFGRGLIEDVGKKIIGQFADCLSTSLGREEPAPATTPPASAPAPLTPEPVSPSTPPAPVRPNPVRPNPVRPAPVRPTPPRPLPPPVADEIDLLDAAGGAVAKRAVPAVAALVLLALVIRWLRSARKGRRKSRPERIALVAPVAATELPQEPVITDGSG